jgi:hypothetical protein
MSLEEVRNEEFNEIIDFRRRDRETIPYGAGGGRPAAPSPGSYMYIYTLPYISITPPPYIHLIGWVAILQALCDEAVSRRVFVLWKNGVPGHFGFLLFTDIVNI